MNSLLLNKKIDLVDYGDVKLFMFQNDNLYNFFVPKDRKQYSLREYYKTIERAGFPKSPFNPDNIACVRDSKACFAIIMNHLWERNIDFSVLDIGAFVGDFSIKIGNLIRTFEKTNKVYAFDPTEAGALIPYNIDINGLKGIVFHENVAVSDQKGYMVFNVLPGLSDSSFAFNKGEHKFNIFPMIRHWFKTNYRLAYVKKFFRYLKPNPSYSLIVEGVSIRDWLKEKEIHTSLFAKIDVEGMDALVVHQLISLHKDRYIISVFEFTPNAYASFDEARSFLAELSKNYIIFDLWYSPRPSRCNRIKTEALDEFVREIRDKRIFGYTDLLLIPRVLPDAKGLEEKLVSLEWDKEEYLLC